MYDLKIWLVHKTRDSSIKNLQFQKQFRNLHPTFRFQPWKKAPSQKKIHKPDIVFRYVNHAESDGAVRFGDL